MDISTIIVSVCCSIIAGVFASFIKPIVDWNFEQKRIKNESRRKLINDAVKFVTGNEFNVLSFRNTNEYLKLSNYFSPELNKIINMSSFIYDIEDAINENDSIGCVYDDVENLDLTHKKMILKELNHLSKKWKLEY